MSAEEYAYEDEQSLLVVNTTPFNGISIPLPNEKYRPHVSQMIRAWLHAKLQRSMSEKTLHRYERHVTDFRNLLLQAGKDLDADPSLIATLAQGWAARPMLDESPSARPSLSVIARKQRMEATGVGPSTFNGRIVSLSSFYEYGIKHAWFTFNPMKMVEPRKVTARDYARHIPMEDMNKLLSRIDRSNLIGKRDYALILLAVMTGRRVAELAGLRWGDILFDGRGKATVIWRRCKGGKVMEDQLESGTQGALLDLMHALYGPGLGSLPPDTPIWVCLSWSKERTPLTPSGIREVWLRRLGTGKVHTTRHTFAVAMEDKNAKLSDIGAKLGHSNLHTTSIYMQRLHSAENQYAQQMEESFIGEGQSRETVPTVERILSKRERTEAIIAAHPELSNAALARELEVDVSTVSRHRKRMGVKRPTLGTNQYSVKMN